MAGWTSLEQGSLVCDVGRVPRARAIGDAVRRVGAYGLTRPRCLARSLAIQDMLRREGIDGAAIHIGVRPAAGKLEAHAWVEFGGEVIGDTREHVRGFADMATTTGSVVR